MSQIPTSWHRLEATAGNWVLVGFSPDAMHALVPPGAQIEMGEEGEKRLTWRHAVWRSDPALSAPIVAMDRPDEVRGLGTRDVVELLPAGSRRFVRDAMARQLLWSYTVTQRPDGRCLDEDRARRDGRALRWILHELADAFPAETWFRRPPSVMPVPDTADELLERVPPDEASRRVRIYEFAEVLAGRAIARVWSFRQDARWDLELFSVRCRRSVSAFLERRAHAPGDQAEMADREELRRDLQSFSRATGN